MNGKIVLLSVIISTLIVVSMNTGILNDGENQMPDLTGQAALDIESLQGSNIASFAFSNIIIFLVLTGVVYLFVRGVVGSFRRS